MELLLPFLLVVVIAILAQSAGTDSRDMHLNDCRPA